MDRNRNDLERWSTARSLLSRIQRTSLLATAALLCVAVLPSVISVANASATSSSGLVWQDTEAAGLLNLGASAQIASSSCTSATFCVAGGYYASTASPSIHQAFVSTYKGSSWTDATIAGALNQGGLASVNSVSCTLATFCVAGGYYADGTSATQAFVSTYNGTSWTDTEVAGALNQANASVNSVSCTSASFCVAGGYFQDSSGRQAFVSTYNGTSWTDAQIAGALNKLYGYAGVDSVSCTSASFCVAGGYYVGNSGATQAFVSTYNGTVWTDTTIADALNQGGVASVNSVSCTSATFCVAGGYFYNGSGLAQAFVSTYNGTVWTDTTIAGALNQGGVASVASVSCTSASFCVAGGYFNDGSSQQALVSTYNGSSWADTKIAGALNLGIAVSVRSVSCTSASFCVAGGYYTDGNGVTQAFVSPYDGNSWTDTEVAAALNQASASVNSVSCASATFCVAGGYFNDSQQAFVSIGVGTLISNLPGSATYGGSFTPTITTSGDGTTSVTSSTTSVCTVTAGIVNYIGVGTCTLIAHVSAGVSYAAADGSAQSFTIAAATPTTPSITNVPFRLSFFAGNGYAGTATEGTATSSLLNGPNGVAVDASGNVYIADSGNNRIEKVTPQGTLSVFAGTGTSGTPTEGTATNSKLNSPGGVAVDSSGNVYIADSGNNRIEKVTPQGRLSFFAGTGTAGAPTAGTATSSNLNFPRGVVVDSFGNVFIADYFNYRVEKVTPQGTLSFFAGTGTSGTPTAGPATSSKLIPSGVAVDSFGNVYIADSGNNRIDKVTPSGTLSIIAGTGTAGAPTAGPATSSNLKGPRGVAVDSFGNVFIADFNNQRIEKVTPQGTLSFFAGTGVLGAPTEGTATSSNLDRPSGVAVDSFGNVYIADYGNMRVEKVSPSGGYGGSFTPTVLTTGDGTTSVTSSTTSVCTVTSGVVNYIGVGTCTLVAHVAAGTNYVAADGSAQSFTIVPGTPSSPIISNYQGSGLTGGSFTPIITTNSDGATSVTSATTSVCTVTSGTVNFIGVGNCSLLPHVAAGTNYAAADGVLNTINISAPAPIAPTTPQVSNLPGSAIYGGSFTPTVSTNGDGVKSVTSSTISVCTITSGTVNYIGVGTCTLVAHVAQGATYSAADGSNQSFTVSRAASSTPSITNLPGSGTFNGSFTPVVSSTGDGAKSVTSSTTSVCTVTSGTVNYIGVGTCTLVAHVGQGSNYSAADGSNQSFTVSRAASSTPSITNLPGSGIFGDSFTPVVSTTGDGSTSVTSSTTSVCTVTSGTVNYIGVGTCTLVAHVAQGTNYSSADGSNQSFTISRAASSTPSITNLPGSVTFNDSFTPVVSTTGDGSTSVTSSTTSVCTVTNGEVNYIGVGTCTLVAQVAQGTNYAGADGSAQSFTVSRASSSTPSITNLPGSSTFGDSFTPVVSTTGDGSTSVTSSTTSVCTVTSGTVNYIGVGTCTLVAHVGQGSNYSAADGSNQSFTVSRAASSTPSITNLPGSGNFNGSFTPVVSTTGDGAKSVTSATTSVCTVTAGTVNYIGVGTCTLVAHVAEGSNYLAADGSNQSFTVSRAASSTPSITNLPGSGTFNGSFTPVVSTTGDGSTSVTSSTTSVCTVTNGIVNSIGAGTCTLVAHVTNGTNYSAADGSAQSFTAGKTVLYVVPDAKAVLYGAAVPSYSFTLHTGSASGTVVAPGIATAPTCTASYTPTTSPNVSPLFISCSGGSDATYAFNTAATARLTIGWGSISPLTLSFAYNGAKLTAVDKKALKRFAATIVASSYSKVTVFGMANPGAQGLDMTLANRRASVVAVYLIGLFSSNPNSKVSVQIAPSKIGRSTNQALNRVAVIEPTL